VLPSKHLLWTHFFHSFERNFFEIKVCHLGFDKSMPGFMALMQMKICYWPTIGSRTNLGGFLLPWVPGVHVMLPCPCQVGFIFLIPKSAFCGCWVVKARRCNDDRWKVIPGIGGLSHADPEVHRSPCVVYPKYNHLFWVLYFMRAGEHK
jgi:hypothetical protein